MRRSFFAVAYLTLGASLTYFAAGPTPSRAQQSDDTVRFKVVNPGQSLYKVAIPVPVGDPQSAALVQEVLGTDLALSGFFKVLDAKSFLADAAKEELTMTPETWRTVGAEGVVKARVTVTGGEVAAELRLYEVVKGQAAVLTKSYRVSASEPRRAAHQFAAEVVKYFTGEDSFFNTQIAFAQAAGRTQELTVMDWDGAGVRKVTQNGSQNILPSWHPSGGRLLYTSFVRGTPDLFSISPGEPRGRRISTRAGLNTGGVFSPDGSRIALTLSQDGNSEIYLLTPDGEIIKRLTENTFIDSSPTWSPDGSQIAFVSDRHGSPQIWVMSASGGAATKLTRRGSYNQEPSWAPRPINGQSLVAFSARDERGAYDIFTVNTQTQELVRLTENRGSNNHPSWAPNARAIAYQSSRGGIYVATGDGKTERQVFRGKGEAPTWGPMRKL